VLVVKEVMLKVACAARLTVSVSELTAVNVSGVKVRT
jgi:hypothetical protein